MSSYNNKDNTLTKFGSNIRVLNTPMEQYVTEGELIESLETRVSKAQLQEDYIHLDIVNDLGEYDSLNSANVKDFGAVGDGVADDSQAFIDAIATGKTNILIPRGSYDLNHVAINLTRDVHFIGECDSFVEILNPNISAPYGISCKGITFNGGTNRNLVHAPMNVMKTRTIALLVTPIDTQDTNISYENCTFKNVDVASWAFIHEDVTHCTINSDYVNNCVFKDIAYCGVYHSVDIVKGVYTNNLFKNIGDEANTIGIITALHPSDTSNGTTRNISECIIRNNIFDVIKGADDFSGSSHDIAVNFVAVEGKNIIIDNNTFKNVVGYGQDREAVYTKGQYVEICNNYIENGGSGEGSICCKNGQTIDWTRSNSVHDNIIVGEFGNGITVYDSDFNIYDNTIYIKHLKANAICKWGAASSDMVNKCTSTCVNNNNIWCNVDEYSIQGQVVTPSTSDTFCGIVIQNAFHKLVINNNHIFVNNDTEYVNTYGVYYNTLNCDCEINGNIIDINQMNNGINLIVSGSVVVPSDISNIVINIKNNILNSHVLYANSTYPIYINVDNNTVKSLQKVFNVINNEAHCSAGTQIGYLLTIKDDSSNVDTLHYVPSQKSGVIYRDIKSNVRDIYVPTTTFASRVALINNTAVNIHVAEYGSIEKVVSFGTLTAQPTNAHKQVMYIGNTDANYIYGGIYECVSDGASTPTYTWQLISIPLATLKSVVAASSDFADYQTRIAAL